MSLKSITVQSVLYASILILALAVRLAGLGALPLSDEEASLALQAVDVARLGDQGAISPQPGYLAFSGLVFALFGSNNFLARLWPALAGAGLVLVPWLFHRQLGAKAGLILALGLALDPGLVALSRQAGSSMPALSLTMLAVGLAVNGWWLGAGILGGLALLSGPSLLHGLVGLAVGAGLVSALIRLGWLAAPGEAASFRLPGSSLRSFLLAGGVTALAWGALFGWHPQGLGSLAASIPAYLDGILSPQGLPALRLLASLALYAPLAVIFGLAGIARSWFNGHLMGQALSIWALAALLVALAYPSRQMGDLAWVLAPLWALAAMELSQHLHSLVEPRWLVWVHAAIVFLLLAMIGLYLAGLANLGTASQAGWMQIGLIAIVLVFGSAVSLLIGLGWSWMAARAGLGFGLCTALGAFSLAALWGSTQTSFAYRQELWHTLPASGDAELLMSTLGDLSVWHTGREDAIEVTLAVESPGLRWLLRSYPKLTVAPEDRATLPGSSPPVLITTPSLQNPELDSFYRGQDFIWRTSPGWSGALPPDFLRWLAFREAPVQQDMVILWARSDLFATGVPAPSESQLQLQVPDPGMDGLFP